MTETGPGGTPGPTSATGRPAPLPPTPARAAPAARRTGPAAPRPLTRPLTQPVRGTAGVRTATATAAVPVVTHPAPGFAAGSRDFALAPVTAPVGAQLSIAVGAAAAARPLPTWPVTALLAGYPLWWAAGLGVLVFPLLSGVMVVALVRRQLTARRGRGAPVILPPGFALWLLFLAVAIIGIGALGADPDGTVAGRAMQRMPGVAYRLGGYLSLTVLLVYVGNLRRMPQAKLVKLLAWLFAVTIAGGLLGMLAGKFQFTSPIEYLLPPEIRYTGFVQSLVHPSAAQVMNLLGSARPRPAAPWGYTNTWGNNFCLLVGWFLVAYWPRRRVFVLVCLAVAVVPAVYSLNRGLWIGLGVMAVWAAVELALRGRMIALAGIALAGIALGVAMVATPLGDIVNQRLDDGKSNGVRLFLTEHAISGVKESPIIGFGSTRNTQGGRQSITVGESADCERCGNFTVGGNGQLWQLLFAHGLLGTAAYLGFFLWVLWKFRRDPSPIGVAGRASLVGTFAAALWYNSLVTPLAFTFIAVALLWRNSPQFKDDEETAT